MYDILMGFYNVKHVKYEQINTNFEDINSIMNNIIDLNVSYPNYLNIPHYLYLKLAY